MNRLHPPRAQWLFDAARLTFRRGFQQVLPPDEPEVLRLVAGLGWHVEAALSPVRTAWMVEELERTFGLNRKAADAAAREGWDLWMQGRLEDAVFSRLDDVARWVRVAGQVPERGLVLHLSAGSRKMAAWGLAHHGRARGRGDRWVGVFGRRGLPPVGKGATRRSWLNERDAAERREEEDRLPWAWLEDEDALSAHLARGGLALVAVDDRGFRHLEPGALFGRPSPLARAPWALAQAHPTSWMGVERLRDKTHLVRVHPSPGHEQDVLGALEADLRRRPGHYAMTLFDRKMRGG